METYYFENFLFRIREKTGHNQYDMPHTGIRKRQSNGMTVKDRAADGEWYVRLNVWYLITIGLTSSNHLFTLFILHSP